jgi:threonine dehydrogenase-like Zn-dependent dehydrogenase
MATHRAAVLSAPETLAVEERPSPPLMPWQVRVRVALAGICGTDLALHRGDLPTALPLVPGHEFVGTVTEVGESRDEAWLGRRVCADINNTCLSRRETTPCRACRLGHAHHCRRRDVTGIIQAPGAFAEEVIVPAENLFAVPDSVSDTQALFSEPLAAAVEAFEQVPVDADDVVAVLGVGRLGALVAATAQRRGAAVLAVARSEESLERVAPLGVGRPLVSRFVDVRAEIDALTEGLGADVVVEATGTPQGLGQALQWVRPRGTIILKTTCGIPATGFDQTRVVVDEVTLVGSRCGPLDRALDMLATGDLPVESLLDETHPLEAIERAIQRAGEVFKVAVAPG